MSSSRRKFAVRHPVVVDIGCSCRRPKLPSFLSSASLLSKPKPPKSPFFSSSTTTTTTTTTASHWDSATLTATTSSFSPSPYDSTTSESPKRPLRAQKKTKKAEERKGPVEEGVAVVKESSDPYLDFRDSMLQMIVEMELYSWEDLRALLKRLLALNAPHHHHLILRAFAEIWAGVFQPASPAATSSAAARSRR